MLINFALTAYAILVVTEQCIGIQFIELPGFNSDTSHEHQVHKKMLHADPDTKNVHKTHEKKSADRKHFRRMEVKANTKQKNLDQYYETETSNQYGGLKIPAYEIVTQEAEETKTEYDREMINTEVQVSSKVEENMENNINEAEVQTESQKRYPPVKEPVKEKVTRVYGDERRHWLVSKKHVDTSDIPPINKDDKDATLKSKINMLVSQTVQDTDEKVKSIQEIKEKHRERAPYKIGFIVSMVKKSRDVLNELFNVAVKHRDEWKALEQLKIFELIVHTNVDTTNLVRQLVEIHVQHLNSTASSGDETTETASGGRRVVLI